MSKLRAVGVDPAFLAAEVEAVASLVDRDEVAAPEEEVFGAVMRWTPRTRDTKVRPTHRLLLLCMPPPPPPPPLTLKP